MSAAESGTARGDYVLQDAREIDDEVIGNVMAGSDRDVADGARSGKAAVDGIMDDHHK